MKTPHALIITAAFCALASESLAIDSSFYKTGPVLGTGLGYSSLSIKTRDTLFFLDNLETNGEFKKTKRSNGFVVDLFSGYRLLINERFIFSLNLSLTKDTNSVKSTIGVPTTSTISQTKIHRQFSVTPDLTAGYIFCQQWMVYLKLGLSISRFNLENKVIGPNATVSTDKTVTKFGIKPTVGIEYAINKKASFFTDLSYEYIPSLKKNLNNPTDPNVFILGATHDLKSSPHYVTGKIGVLYKF